MDVAHPPVGSVPEAALAHYLRELPDAVVLRNEEDLFGNLRRGGDVDLLVSDLELAERLMIHHLGAPVQVVRRSYSIGYSYDWGHVDMQSTLEWHGACFLERDAVLGGRSLSARGRPVPRIAHEAAISWLTNLLFGAFFKERYAAEIRQAVVTDGAAFRQTLGEAAGPNWGVRLWQAAAEEHPEMSGAWSRPLRRAVWWRACFKAPIRTLRRYLAYVSAEVSLRLAPPVPWVAILGSDGSGKSTVVQELVQRFAACPYASLRGFHWRPRVIARTHGAEPVTDPHGRPSRGPIGSALRLAVLATDWLLGYWGRLVHLRAKGVILVFDRMYFDLAVDPKRYRYGGGPWMARALWWWLPKPDLVFFLDVPPDVLLRRKQEAARPELERQRHAYTTLVRRQPGGHVLDGSRPAAAVVDDIQRIIRAWLLDRSVARLKSIHGPAVEARASADASSGAPVLVGRGDGAP